MHGGTISYTSDVNVGSVFAVIIPFKIATSPKNNHHSRSDNTTTPTIPSLKRNLSHYCFSPYPTERSLGANNPIDTHLNVLGLQPMHSIFSASVPSESINVSGGRSLLTGSCELDDLTDLQLFDSHLAPIDGE